MQQLVGEEKDCRIYVTVFTGFTTVFASNGPDLGIFVTFSLDALNGDTCLGSQLDPRSFYSVFFQTGKLHFTSSHKSFIFGKI